MPTASVVGLDTAMVFVIGSKSQAQRGLFYMNAIRHSQCWWNEENGKTGPCACVKGKSQENQLSRLR
jgi:hypothetical protein